MISVIIPALNEEKLLEKMLGQFTPEIVKRYDLEVLVSDGGSVDRTLAIARSLAVRVVENIAGVKQTISRGRNLGAPECRHADQGHPPVLHDNCTRGRKARIRRAHLPGGGLPAGAAKD
jgi:glycosyltransferase involved in cell wall biosynthesis